jgi:hypothetical protein
MVQFLMESFGTQQALLSWFSTFNPYTLEVGCEFGDVDDQLKSMEADLGIDWGWSADTEESHGRRMEVKRYQQTFIEDVNDAAACSGTSCWSNFLQ